MPKKVKSDDTLTASALLSLVGASNSTLSRWIAKGLPHSRETTGHGGARRLLFNRDSAMQWIVENASLSSAQLARALKTKATPEPTPEPDTATPDPDSIDDEGLLPCLERLRKTERETFRLLQRLKRSGDIGGVRIVSERFVSEVRALASIEAAAVSYRLRIGELIRTADAEGAYMRVLVGVKNAVLGMPNAIMPIVIGYLKDPNKAHEVALIMDSKVRDILRMTAQQGRAERAAREAGAAEGTAIPPATGKVKRKPRATG